MLSTSRIFCRFSSRFAVSAVNSAFKPQLCCISTIVQPRFIQENQFQNNLSTNYISVRSYAKGKDKKKDKGKGKVHVNEEQLGEIVNVDNVRKQMEKAVQSLKDDFAKHLSLRSTAGSIESIMVKFDGGEHTLQELAQIVRKNPKLIVINMSVFPQAIPAVLEAISKSGMNLNPQQEGTTLYVPVPKVTKEHRESLVKNAKQLFTKCKDAVRDVQNKQNKSIKKKSGISEDILRNAEQQIIAIADAYIDEAQKTLDAKQTELIGKD